MRKTILMMIFSLCVFCISGPAQAETLIQVQSGQDAAAAQKEADRLFELGAPAFSRVEQAPDQGVWNRVYIGPFENESDAEAAAEALLKQGAIKEYLLKSESAPEASAGILPPPTAAQPAADGGLIVIGPDGQPMNLGSDGGEGQMAVNPSQGAGAPFELPVAETPTYGEPVSPEQAREMGLGREGGAASLPTYGEAGQTGSPVSPSAQGSYGDSSLPKAQAQPKGQDSGLPPGFKVGDDMPSLQPNPAALPAPADGGVPAASDKSSALPLPPSAGEGEDQPILTAQLGDGSRASSQRGQASMHIAGFTILVDLSSSMRNPAPCGGRIKEEAVGTLLRKMNRRIPNHPYTASLRVFGYKRAWTWKDFTMLYYGPATYNTDAMEDSIAKLIAADSISPFSSALDASDNELQGMGSPKAVLMFADFEPTVGSGDPTQSAAKMRRSYGQDISIHTFYVTRQTVGERLAKNIAKAGGGNAYNICRMLDDEIAFENMMLDVFGPGSGTPCVDSDGDGVCDDDDLCPNTPPGAPVDERGCWVAAYSQFFDFDKAVVKNAFLPRIKHAAEVLNNNKGLPTVIIAGHTDSIGSPDYNNRLGLRRAEAVKELLIKYGVASERLRVESFGATRPVTSNDTEEGRARNRRVEFHIGEVAPHSRK